jgi:hypothetical protein
MSNSEKGSRKHILDWTGSANFCRELSRLIDVTGAVVGPGDFWMPRGDDYPDECKLKGRVPTPVRSLCDWRGLSDWWLAHKRGANVPNWDLLATCAIDGKKGLVLVEGKAHKQELDGELKGKPLSHKQRLSTHSLENHERIGRAIEEARVALAGKFPAIRISRDSYYQLSNRVAYAWKIVSMGLPVVLVYLGFMGDRYFPDHFVSDAHWQHCMQEHMEGIMPSDFLETPIDCGKARMLILVRSRGIAPLLEGQER